MPDLPYASATSGKSRESEIRDLLTGAGADAVGFMVDNGARRIVCQFRIAGREATVPVSMADYERAWRRAYPRGPRTTVASYEARARRTAELAVWAILHDWIKAQVALILGGLATPEMAFLPHIHLPDGRRVSEALSGPDGRLGLPAPESRDA
jgi:hypothetical protein